jgi:hypothetical protein
VLALHLPSPATLANAFSLFTDPQKFAAIFVTLVAGASAFAPQPAFTTKQSTSLFAVREYGKYDDKLWDNAAKVEIYNAWDPNAPRTVNNFNPFETWEGNSPDASGFYPGEVRLLVVLVSGVRIDYAMVIHSHLHCSFDFTTERIQRSCSWRC